ncbi:hypothetical protein Val02_48000 [Virgisporangium aliadipatigenens]|uniref:Uncharacterized protein n=1 Tax=Virgisporangium aliadipatigenens TaxID=741659 RepID=A0A8J3YLY6_9ACTN|nr:PQQ-binding-like beta-propeller repeat protein [Virgisporangium aliadipatigenens]GIJ47914.1 hypothetical protein Val02_48000 [Virgisporangium aliadipatigenens]
MRRRTIVRTVGALAGMTACGLVAVLTLPAGAADRAAPTEIRVSESSTGAPADESAGNPAMSGDGRYVVFESKATNLTAGADDFRNRVFLRDLRTGQVRALPSAIGDDSGDHAWFSPNGTHFVVGSTDGFAVYDAATGAVRYTVAVGANAAEPRVTDDGRSLFYVDYSLTRGVTRFVVFDSATGENRAVPLPGFTRDPGNPQLSGDGRYLAFETAQSLVPTDTDGFTDVYRADLTTGELLRVSVTTDGGPILAGESFMPRMSADGRYIVFQSEESPFDRLGGVYLRDVRGGTTEAVTTYAQGIGLAAPDVSDDGRYVSFVEGTGVVKVRDRRSGQVRVAVDPERVQPTQLSSDGRTLVYAAVTAGFDPSQVYVRTLG